MRSPILGRVKPPDRWTLLIVAIAVIAGGLLVWLGRGTTFWWDEWDFIGKRSLGDPATWFAPRNEHWVLLPTLVYRAIVETIGIGSYIPYLAAVAILHVAVVAGVYRLVRGATASGAMAVATGALIALFGSGFENLFWGFQIGFVGATAMCLWAMVALRTSSERLSPARIASAVALLTAAVASAGVALAFVAGIWVEVLLDPRRRRYLPLLVIPALVWGAWFAMIGRTSAAQASYPIGVDTPLVIGRVDVAGFSSAAGAISGLGPQLGALGLAVIAIAAIARWRRNRLAPEAVGPIAGVFALYVILGLARGATETDAAINPRVTYESGVLLLVGLAAIVGAAGVTANPRFKPFAIAATGALLALGLTFNLRLLLEGRDVMLGRADLTRALVTVALDPNPPPGTDRNRSLIVVPSPVALDRIVAAYGSPLGDRFTPDAVRPIPAATLADARTWLTAGPPSGISGD
jgi:hypothetical protein